VRITSQAALPEPKTTPAAFVDGLVGFVYQLEPGEKEPNSDLSMSDYPAWDPLQALAVSYIRSVDPVFAVALYRFAAYLSRWWSGRAIYHLGINNGDAEAHGAGRAIDISGLLWVDAQGGQHEFLVHDDWGKQPIPGMTRTTWPESLNFQTKYRLAAGFHNGQCAPRFFAQFYHFLCTQLVPNGPSSTLPDDPNTNLQCNELIKFPDWWRAGPAFKGSVDHNNHYHAQLPSL
jgi:hypothetical protein